MLDSILDDVQLCSLDLGDQMLYVRLLATLNRQHSTDGRGSLTRLAATALAGRERWAYAEPAYRRLVAGGLVAIDHRAGGIEYLVSNWPKIQGLTPTGLRRDSDGTPPLRVEERRVGVKNTLEDSCDAQGASRPNPIVNLLRGGDPPAEADEWTAWWEAEGPRIEAEAAARLPDASTPRQLGAKVKSIALGWWRHYLAGERAYRGAAREHALAEATRRTRERLEHEARTRTPPAAEALPLLNVRRI